MDKKDEQQQATSTLQGQKYFNKTLFEFWDT